MKTNQPGQLAANYIKTGDFKLEFMISNISPQFKMSTNRHNQKWAKLYFNTMDNLIRTIKTYS